MRTSLIAVVALILLADASRLAADDSPVPIHLGASTFAVPPDWLELEGADFAQGRAVTTVFLTPPPDAFDGTNGVVTDGIDDITILLHEDTGNERLVFIEFPLASAAEKFGPATQEGAAVAFDGIAFATLRGGPTASAGKSANQFLVLVGSIALPGYDTIVVSTRIEHADTAMPLRRYTISALFEAQGANFLTMISLETSRPLRAADLGLVDAVAGVVRAAAPE